MTAGADSLFPDLDLQPIELPEPVVEQLSRGRKLTLRQRADIDAGRHPLMRGLRLREPAGETCGTCTHRHLVGSTGRCWPKCEIRGDSRSDASDCRAWWPACTEWKPKP